MPRDNQPWRAMPRARLAWTADNTPQSSAFGDIYFSPDDGLAESRHVFVAGNRLAERLAQHPRAVFTIGETGFGSGLNFLLSWQLWANLPAPRPRLHYLSVECYPLRREELARALASWPELAPLAAQLLAAYPAPIPGCHRLQLAQGQITLDLWWAEAGETLAELRERGQPLVDAWYLDGFAPARNADMWRAALLADIGALSRPGATVATFTAAGAVRRTLAAAGFAMGKVPGFGRKREQLTGQLLRSTARAMPAGSPWDLPEHYPESSPRSALVLGAGLAGCATAAALARRGVAVSLLDRAALAGAGSGNAQGVLYTRLSRRHSALTDFALLSYAHASRRYRQMFDAGELREGRDGELCGVFQQQAERSELAALAPLLTDIPELAAVLDPAAASARLGVIQEQAGYWFPDAGWMAPAALCRAWAAASAVALQEHCGSLRLRHRDHQWQAVNAAGQVVASADCAVIACAGDSAAVAGLNWLPLRSIRGQTTHFPAGAPFSDLRAVLCHDGYISPASTSHCIGATFGIDDCEQALRVAYHHHNLDALAAAVPAWRSALAALDPASTEGRVGFRCASPDYLPLAGPVPDLPILLARFAGLRQNARKPIAHYGSNMPGLYLNTGHGSRGLTSTPLCAELVASQICGEAPPLPRTLVRALAPARFPLRDLARKRI
ncbi:MAG: bifunctional tRNA (5-methylaminomethyl-2-thiouridine)(34)-methyltransferase MnmD/FAD-dependent 5-carboxymethylaminomethyl-2-thiouridine(34) oxidoreductase MnmC [Parahaliea sp.]